MKRKYVYASRQEAETAAAVNQREASLMFVAVQCALHERPDFNARVGRYRLQLYRADSACGGIAIVTFYGERQSPHSDVCYFENWYNNAMLRTPRCDDKDEMAISELANRAYFARQEVYASKKGIT
jgi:hypothetical protein